MEEATIVTEKISEEASGFLEQAVHNIYSEYPHEIQVLLFSTASIIFGVGAYKEYGLISKKNIMEEL